MVNIAIAIVICVQGCADEEFPVRCCCGDFNAMPQRCAEKCLNSPRAESCVGFCQVAFLIVIVLLNLGVTVYGWMIKTSEEEMELTW